MKRFKGLLVLMLVVAGLVASLPAAGASQRVTTVEPVSWWWDESDRVGVSVLHRSDDGIRALFASKGYTPGDAVTLWAIHFNNPSACATSPCSVPADVFNEAAEADFYWVAGKVVGPSGRLVLRGSLAVGQTAYSGKVEIGAGDAVPLVNPFGAEIVLATHSHGPAAEGEALAAQLTSFTGGCEVFNGADGFATGPQDIPDAVGECSTIQGSRHQ